MSDDLSKLTPTDPSAVAPDWTDKRQDILEGLLATDTPRRSGAWRWVAGAAAAVLFVVAIGGITQQLRREPWATPASPTPTTGAGPTDLVAAQSRVIFKGGGAILCRASLIPSPYPLGCDGIPVQGLSPQEVPWTEQADGAAWADVIVTGTFDGTTLHALDVYRTDDDTAPRRDSSLGTGGNYDGMGQLCQDPVMGHGPGDRPLGDVERELTTYQGSWGRDPYNVAVTGDVESARNTLVDYVEGEFCVATLPGPSAADGHAAEARAQTVSGVQWADYSALDHGASLQVTILVDDAGVRDALETAVGQEVWPSTDVASFFYPVQRSTPTDPVSSPTPSIRAGEGHPEVAALGTLLDTGNGITMCNGHLTDSSPPQCPFTTPVMGITWDDVPWAETTQASIPETAKTITWAGAVIVGNFDGDTFVTTQVFPRDARDVPLPPATIADEELPTLCEAPMRGSGGDSVEALIETADALPGYQALWLSPNQVTYNVAVTADVDGARSALAEIYGGELCVGTVDGPTEQALQDAELALEPLTLDVDSATTAAGSVWSTYSSVSTRGNRLEVYVERDTPLLLDQIESAVGADVWSHTDVIPFFYPLVATPTPDPTPVPSLEPSTPTTASSFTDEQQGWAEKTVADILGVSGQPGTADVTARMARVTYAQYMSVWNIDVPGTPEPPADDMEILVIALSAPLDGSQVGGGPPFLGSPDPTTSPEPREPIGTLSVLDPATGENLSQVVILGGDPPADRIVELPGPIEDVTLPERFR